MPNNQQNRLNSSPGALFIQSIVKMVLFLVVFGGIAYLMLNQDTRNDLLKGSVFNRFEEGVENGAEFVTDSLETNTSGIQVTQFFPPKQLKVTDFEGVEHSYPFFQRSRIFVPRFKFGATPDSNWSVKFTLDPESESPRDAVVDNLTDKTVKARFLHTKPGKHTLLVEILGANGEVLKTLRHDEIWVLDKSIALLGDSIFRGAHIESFASSEVGVPSRVFSEDIKFSYPKRYEGENYGHGLDIYLEKAFADLGKVVFPVNLSSWISPGYALNGFVEGSDVRKPYLFSIDGKLEHEAFLGIDEFWIGFFHDAIVKGNLGIVEYEAEMNGLLEYVLDRGIMTDQIKLIKPTFSSEIDMKAYREVIDSIAKKWNVKVAADLYVPSREEFGKFVSLDNEPALTGYGMEKIARLLAEEDVASWPISKEEEKEVSVK